MACRDGRDRALDPSALLARLQEIMPQGRPYPSQTEAFVISLEMHIVVIAAAMTVTQEELFTIDPGGSRDTRHDAN